MLIVLTVALILLRSELAGQLVLLHFISIIVVLRLARFFFSHALGRQLDAIRSKLAAGWHADAVRTRQLRTNPLFHLRTRCAPCCQAKDRCRRCCGRSSLLNAFRYGCYSRRRVDRRNRNRRRLRNRLLHRFRHRLIPGGQLFAFTRTTLFDFFEIVQRRTRRLHLFHDFRLRFRLRCNVRLHRFNGFRHVLLIRLGHWLLILLRCILRLRRLIRLLPLFLLHGDVAFRFRRNNGLRRMNTRRSLPVNLRLLNNGFRRRDRRGWHHGVDRRGIRLRSGRRGGGSRNRLGNRVAVQQWIVFVEVTRRGTATGKKHIIRIDGGTCCTVLNLLVFIHAFTGEERRIGFTAQRVGKFLSNTLATRQRTAQNSGTTRLATLHRRVVFLFIFVFVFIHPRIVTTGTVTGEGQNGEDKAANFLGNAHPGPAGKQRQPGGPDAQQRQRAAAAVQHRLKRGT